MKGHKKVGRVLGAVGAVMMVGALVMGPAIAQADSGNDKGNSQSDNANGNSRDDDESGNDDSQSDHGNSQSDHGNGKDGDKDDSWDDNGNGDNGNAQSGNSQNEHGNSSSNTADSNHGSSQNDNDNHGSSQKDTDDPNGDKNATTCAEVGAEGIQYNGPTKTSSGGVPGLFTVTVTENKYVTISPVDGAVQVNAVVVKGGPAFNVYTPTSSPPLSLNMQSPSNGGGNVPDISHWFACYSSSGDDSDDDDSDDDDSDDDDSDDDDDDSDDDDDDGDDDDSDDDDGDDEVGDDNDEQQSETPVPEEQLSEAPVPEDKTESGSLPLTGWLGSNLILGLGLAMLASGGLAVGFTRRSSKS